MKKQTALAVIGQSEKATLYSISFEKDGTTEFEKFVRTFEKIAAFNPDYQRIMAAIQTILSVGALEHFFRPEGRMNDSVFAIHIDGWKLRLYCLRLSEQIVILGNGGLKDGRTHDDHSRMSAFVIDLQRFEKDFKDRFMIHLSQFG